MKKIITTLVVIGALVAVWYFIDGNKESETMISETSRIQVALVGTWSSVDDQESVVAFDSDGTFSDTYNDVSVEVGSWEVYEQSGTVDEPTGIFLRKTTNDGEMLYAVLTIDTEILSLSYLARGNTLNYTRIANPSEI
ncbi:hypothetical protein COB18_01025 [Candidatus Kaiserbacteria bacterium]|nr:MAG: hypothetical protein COB18_01025 [Candidatus Kaiserbacteria bacterium]